MWRIIVAVVTAAAVTTVIVVSCHDQRERARRDVAEPAYVETTSATASSASESPTVSPLAGAAMTERGEEAARPVPPVVTAPPATTVVPPAPIPDAATAVPPSTAPAPAPTVGAGRFITEAPFWGSSAFPFNSAEAGAGPFRE
jgi:hypothetical protein